MGDGGGTGGLGGDTPRPGGVRRNDATCDTVGVALNDFASVRSRLGPATNTACPSGQQFVQVVLRRASDESLEGAVVGAAAAGSSSTGDP